MMLGKTYFESIYTADEKLRYEADKGTFRNWNTPYKCVPFNVNIYEDESDEYFMVPYECINRINYAKICNDDL